MALDWCVHRAPAHDAVATDTVQGMSAWRPPIECVHTRRDALVHLCVRAAQLAALLAVVVAVLNDANSIALLMTPVLLCAPASTSVTSLLGMSRDLPGASTWVASPWD